MSKQERRRPPGFTLIELLIVIAIIGILIASIAVAVTKAKEYANQMKRATQLKQLSQAFNIYHERNDVYPNYCGKWPQSGNQTYTVYGGWFTHLLPYMDQDPLYRMIREQYAAYGNGGGSVPTGSWSPSPKLVKAAVTAPNLAYTGSTTTTTGNGYTLAAPDNSISPTITVSAAEYDYSGSTWIPAPGNSTVPRPTNGYVGVWDVKVRTAVFQVLLCPSDPSAQRAEASQGLVYKHTSTPWGATNYLANWNAITNQDSVNGYKANPGRKQSLKDGAGNTILLAEAYRWCENKGRTALLPWHTGNGGVSKYGGVHNFGITFAMGNASLTTSGGSSVTLNNANGVSNPSVSPDINFGFQIQPSDYLTGDRGCNSLTVQSPHQNLNIVFGDSSTKAISGKVSKDIWLYLVLPSDGNPIPDF